MASDARSFVRCAAASSCVGSYLRLIDSCITQLKAQAPSRTCNESKEDERSVATGVSRDGLQSQWTGSMDGLQGPSPSLDTPALQAMQGCQGTGSRDGLVSQIIVSQMRHRQQLCVWLRVSGVCHWGLEAHASRDHTLVGPLWEGYHESRRCSRDTCPESYITKHNSTRRLGSRVQGSGFRVRETLGV